MFIAIFIDIFELIKLYLNKDFIVYITNYEINTVCVDFLYIQIKKNYKTTLYMTKTMKKYTLQILKIFAILNMF